MSDKREKILILLLASVVESFARDTSSRRSHSLGYRIRANFLNLLYLIDLFTIILIAKVRHAISHGIFHQLLAEFTYAN